MFRGPNQEFSKKNLGNGDYDNYSHARDGHSQNLSYHYLPTQGNAHNQSIQYASTNAYFCDEHNDPVTNYCANLDCLRPLCPDCIDAHYKYHLQSSTIPQIESIKNMKINCSKKVETAIHSLQKEMNDCELRYLLDPEQIINEGVSKINHTKEKILLMHQLFDIKVKFYCEVNERKPVILQIKNQQIKQNQMIISENILIQCQQIRKFFEMQEEIYVKRVNENLLRAGDFTGTFDKITTLIQELEQLKYTLDGNSFLSGINRICRLDLISLRDKFKSDIHKIVQSRELEPIQVLIDDQRVVQLKQDLDQIVILAKQSEQQPRYQQNIHNKSSNIFQQSKQQNNLISIFQIEYLMNVLNLELF